MRYVPSASNERVDLVLAEILGSLGDLGHGAATRGGGGEAAAPGTAPSGVSHDGDRGSSVGGGVDGGAGNGEMVLTKAAWCSAMASWLQVFDHRNPLATHTGTHTYMPPHATLSSCPRLLQTNSERRHNLIVVIPTTPAQYFHCLRRQIHRPFSKPLVLRRALSRPIPALSHLLLSTHAVPWGGRW
jgi:hypothetical protein